MEYRKGYESWISDGYIDADTKAELIAIGKDENEIKERFYKTLEFGTGGLRGVLGAGTNRMNIYNIRKVTQGLANFILKQGPEARAMGVCIAHDSRRMSREFTLEAALCLTANAIKTYVFEGLRPTPQLSFSVRELGCIAGIVITASHNPPEYNGYKVYWSDGGQVPYPMDGEIIDEVNEVVSFSQIKTTSAEKAVESGLLTELNKEMDDKYINTVLKTALNRDVVLNASDDFNVVYTPLNGAGYIPVTRILSEIGLKNVFVVPEQAMPDPDFTTIGYPNPEDPKAYKYALALAKEKNADIIIATDPDADRMGAMIPHNGEYVMLTGNMAGVLMCEYVLSQSKKKGILPGNGAVISTIVSTNMTKCICDYYGVEFYEVLTGFKYIGEKIKLFEKTGSNTFLFGFEESFGYLAGTYARDKDAVGASMLMCEIAAYYKLRNKTLVDALNDLYEKYGFFMETNESVVLPGIDGAERMDTIMLSLRENPPKRFGEKNVVRFMDYKAGTVVDNVTGEITPANLPKSDVLYFELPDSEWVCVRPSGTEPKIKLYFGVCGESADDASVRLMNLQSAAKENIIT